MSNSVTCPSCRHEFEVTQVLTAQLTDRIRAELQQEVARQRRSMEEQARKLSEDRKQLEQSQATVDQQIAERLKQERAALLVQARQQAEAALALELQDQKAEVEGLKKRLSEAQKAELAVRERERELQRLADEQELIVARRLDDERAKIRQETLAQSDEEHRLKLAEKEELLAQMKKQLDDLRRKSDQGSQQLKGEVLEIDLENALVDTFPTDTVTEVAKGVSGGDALQYVSTTVGRCCGSILWETKRTKHWSNTWLPKLRDDPQTLVKEFMNPAPRRSFPCVQI